MRNRGEIARVLIWSGRERRTVLVPVAAGGRVLSDGFVDWCCETLATRGAGEVYTPALSEFEAGGFRGCGFEPHDELWLLVRALGRDAPPVPNPSHGVKIKRARGGMLDRIAALDAESFSPFWALDEQGLRDARAATAGGCFVAALAPDLAGYAITGWGGGQAYLQRIAVSPERRREGIGHDLVADSLRRAARRLCAQMLVNTQVGNDAALELYERCGFVLQESRLFVLRRVLDDRSRSGADGPPPSRNEIPVAEGGSAP